MNDKLTEKAIGSAMRVHSELGPGFLESVYGNALAIEMADFVLEGRVILELKAVEAIAPVHEVQIVNYLKATGYDIGLILNFGAQSLEVRRKNREYKATKNPFARTKHQDNLVNPNESR